ncbi:drug resistance transporter, EmrB/QacA subfamily [Stackebrandtia nassauensis DSM 44728]|uniref:Drug resistance transporter, EmrB/QacA subfamily n=1 Tax=Stackebrandtia nassauensis (strain DSM 44728 / CIP 108903 / NRRL B-16338 / NBRC 102104 / LLR-40K-21) TaxID=446470 RepID=D3Q3G4_STANL|nr:drug resistance transporter, EmrB/QacA subfamily [Stackebrandtia nassauensis DSM 44728]
MTTAEDTALSTPMLSRGRMNIVFVTIMLGMLMAALDQTIVATALPTIVADLGGAGHMAWVVTAYLLAETIATAVVGKFGDLFGRKIVFQISAIVFVAGSALAGLSGDMVFLIVARAIQGLGGGGLMVTAMALIADVIPLRDRGRYQGAMGAVFGVTTVLGPTMGGLFTDHLSWRWCFYVNVPVAVVMVAMAAWTIPSVKAAARPLVDYVGLILVALGSSGLILALEWGGEEYAWDSVEIIGLFAGSALMLVLFVFAELRAAEPILPMHLFRSRVFTVSAILSFIVGFAMLGAMTYLPTYLQYVDGVSATASGLRTLPLVAGLLATSMLSGSVVSRTGRYKVFPIAGTAVMALGLYLMSTMNADTGVYLESVYMLILGLGIGLAMQVLTIAVQNTVPYHEMGAATSGVTFFRTLGSAFGTAIFGTLYSNDLSSRLADAYRQTPGVNPEAVASPEALHKLPDDTIRPIVDAYADTVDYVFFWVVPVAILGFAVSWFLKEVPLRDSARASVVDLGEGFAAPDGSANRERLARSLAKVIRREHPDLGRQVLAESGSTLPPERAWALTQIYVRTRVSGAATLAGMARAHRLPPEVLLPTFDACVEAGLIAVDGDRMRLTEAGEAEMTTLVAALRRWLDTHLDDWDITDPVDRAALDRAVDELAHRMIEEERSAEFTSAEAKVG